MLVSRAVYRLGWKKVEYIYTEREKSFVGITIVFVILWLCGHLYRAFHGRRGSWSSTLSLPSPLPSPCRHPAVLAVPPLATVLASWG